MSYTSNPLVRWLLSRAYGQGGTVAVPYATSFTSARLVQRGKFPAGVQDVLERLEKRYREWPSSSLDDSPIEWCFLVGGPGNGKSEALKHLANRLSIKLPEKIPGAAAQRVVPETWPSQASVIGPSLEIAFVNDASIPHSDLLTHGQLGSLFLDVSEGIDRLLNKRTPVALFGNVNRGILIEEQEKLDGSHPRLSTVAGGIAAQVIRWLVNPPSRESISQSELETVVFLDPVAPYYGQFCIHLMSKGATHDITSHVVFLDVLSLLEPTPGSPGSAVDFSAGRPAVSPYQTIGGFSQDSSTREQTVAGEFLATLVDASQWEMSGCVHPEEGTLCDAFGTCPFAQNARWLRHQVLQQRFLDTLRAAEIATARRLTYRDLLGHISLALLGQPEAKWLEKGGSEPCHWTAEKIQDLGDSTRAGEAIVDLASHRVYMNLFPTPDRMAWKDARATSPRLHTIYGAAMRRMTSNGEASRVAAFEQGFNQIDPARDVEPWEDGVRIKVLDMAEALDVALPSDQLFEANFIPVEAISEIEKEVDRLLIEEVKDELGRVPEKDDRDRRAPLVRTRFLRKWRSTLLLRQVGLALGHLAFAPVLKAWLAEQENALSGRSTPLGLGQGIQNLIIPSPGKLWLAPFRPRTYGLVGDLPSNTLLVEIPINNLRVEIVSRGDMLIAEVQVISSKKIPESVASLVIDLAVAREAFLHKDANMLSFTEIGNSAFARIERARASLIGRNRMKQATVYFTDTTGKRYRLAVNLVGQTQLRVLPA